MERSELLELRNEIINAPIGSVLFEFIHDYITQEACKNINADELKGMCRLAQKIKDIPKEIK